jgi:hypothetical protein
MLLQVHALSILSCHNRRTNSLDTSPVISAANDADFSIRILDTSLTGTVIVACS